MSIVYLNGELLDESEAKVSVFDRGFLFADSVYEVIPAYAGKFFRFKQHIQRLNNSLQQIKMDLQLDEAKWLQIAQELLAKNQLQQASLYLQVTRGTAAIRSHEFPSDFQATIFAMVNELPPVFEEKAEIQGIKVVTCEDIRWDRCDIKTTALLANCLLLQKALESGADDSILVRQGKVIEATASNVFLVIDGEILTPILSDDLLAGVTRDFVIRIAKKLGYPVKEQEIDESQFLAADEVWLTSSNKEIRPVISLNHDKIGDGQVGKVWRQINAAYQKLKYELYQGQFATIDDIEIEG